MKDKIIVIFLATVFLVEFSAMVCDLYGRNFITKTQKAIISSVIEVTPSPSLASANPKNQQANKNDNPSPQNKTESNVSYSSYSQCIENAKDLPQSKDCCDCLSTDSSTRKACRDFGATYDFTKNTVFKTFEIPSKLGRNGDYSTCTASNNQQQCKQCCDSSTQYVCGDFQYCRTACDSLSK